MIYKTEVLYRLWDISIQPKKKKGLFKMKQIISWNYLKFIYMNMCVYIYAFFTLLLYFKYSSFS